MINWRLNLVKVKLNLSFTLSGIRESNPHTQLGRLEHYRYANSAG